MRLAIVGSVVLTASVVGSICFSNVAAAETVEFRVSSSHGAAFERNGVVFYSRGGGAGGGRGFTVAAVDPASETGNIIDVRTFDTWGSGCSAHDGLVAFIDGFSIGTLLLIAVGDEAGLRADACSERTRVALEGLGSRQIRNYEFRNAWAMIVVKGEGTAIAEVLGKGQWPLRVVEARLAFPLSSPTPSSPRALWCLNPEAAPPFAPIPVTIEDEGGNHLLTVEVLRPTIVCGPAGMNTRAERPLTVDSWMVCYDLTAFAIEPNLIFRLQTALGTHTFQVDALNAVCIPARPVS